MRGGLNLISPGALIPQTGQTLRPYDKKAKGAGRVREDEPGPNGLWTAPSANIQAAKFVRKLGREMIASAKLLSFYRLRAAKTSQA